MNFFCAILLVIKKNKIEYIQRNERLLSMSKVFLFLFVIDYYSNGVMWPILILGCVCMYYYCFSLSFFFLWNFDIHSQSNRLVW